MMQKVYFLLRESEPPVVKIGCSRDPKGRLASFQAFSPEPLRLVRVIDGDIPLERFIHDRFSEYRIRREWFRFTEDMLTEEFHPDMVYAPIKTVRHLFMEWRGYGNLCDDLGLTPFKVHKMADRNVIPEERWGALIASAEKRGIQGVSHNFLSQFTAANQKRLKQDRA